MRIESQENELAQTIYTFSIFSAEKSFNQTMSYHPGTHLIASLHSTNSAALSTCTDFKILIDELVRQHQLQKLGEVYHNFSPAGFTAIICLSESHISIHTWPEHGRVNLDIYLSNYERENDGTVQEIYQSFISFFEAAVVDMQTLKR